MIHELKTEVKYFNEIRAERKTFELRKNDRNYQIGDLLILKEYISKTQVYTGASIIASVKYIMKKNEFFDLKDYVIMSIRVIDLTPAQGNLSGQF